MSATFFNMRRRAAKRVEAAAVKDNTTTPLKQPKTASRGGKKGGVKNDG